ncbi:VOC family protein [Roseiterribacter gracilis]|uniref:VOC family protein n=1 Tax=Roseiterribacter gracilis TaxID=2812848 RepID=A0A8S8XAD8_9PROT|nr:VOC family protein [Rhodospirillales bacterium TMPK1]
MATISSKISPCLWFNNEGEEAARFYTSLFPKSKIDRVIKSPIDTPSGKEGTVLVIDFTLAGQSFMALNGGSKGEYTQALSLAVECDDQAEVDHLWNGLKAGGKEVACGWLQDRYGISWQIVPRQMLDMLRHGEPAKAKRAMQAMMTMVKLDLAALQKAYDGK